MLIHRAGGEAQGRAVLTKLLAFPLHLGVNWECFLSFISSDLALGSMSWHVGHSLPVPVWEACLCSGQSAVSTMPPSGFCLWPTVGNSRATHPEQTLC